MVHFVSAMGRLLKAGRDCTEVSKAASILVYGTPRKEKGASLSRFSAQDEFCRRASSWNMTNLRNGALRPAKPALGNGHVQRLAKRALLMLDGRSEERRVGNECRCEGETDEEKIKR